MIFDNLSLFFIDGFCIGNLEETVQPYSELFVGHKLNTE